MAAIRSIEQRNAQAMARADISITDWSEDRIKFEEELLMNGFQIQPNHALLERARDGMGSVVKAADPGRAEAA